ncbi:MAG: helix-turn-helix domain-containing protein [Rhizobiales bacterium]|nr:helix-turn-helix domain-containing protein [Hyphomicrobiales bacterium]
MSRIAPPPHRQQPGTAITQTLERGLEVLRAFDCEPRSLSNRIIAERTGLPKSAVTRITSTLVSLGYLNRTPGLGHYQLGARVFDIGNAYLERSALRRVARPVMERFADRRDVSCGLAIADRKQMIYVVWCPAPKTLTLRLAAGSKLPMARTAIGKAYLWALPPAERRDVLALIKQSAREHADEVMTGIKTAFNDLDQHGYCISIAEFQKNTFGIAVPIVLDDGQTVLSLNAGGARLDVTEAFLRRNIAPDLITTAAELRSAIADAHAFDF